MTRSPKTNGLMSLPGEMKVTLLLNLWDKAVYMQPEREDPFYGSDYSPLRTTVQMIKLLN